MVSNGRFVLGFVAVLVAVAAAIAIAAAATAQPASSAEFHAELAPLNESNVRGTVDLTLAGSQLKRGYSGAGTDAGSGASGSSVRDHRYQNIHLPVADGGRGSRRRCQRGGRGGIVRSGGRDIRAGKRRAGRCLASDRVVGERTGSSEHRVRDSGHHCQRTVRRIGGRRLRPGAAGTGVVCNDDEHA